VWAVWYVLANRGQPFAILPTDQDFVTLRRAMGWLWWASVCVLTDFLACVFLGWLVLPWGLSLILAAVVLPALDLTRPSRPWSLGMKVAVTDFVFLRLLYILAVLAAYPEEVFRDGLPASGSLWWAWGLRLVYAGCTLAVAWRYARFIKRSVRMYDPFPEDEPPRDPTESGKSASPPPG
jgi:hypothetical protein